MSLLAPDSGRGNALAREPAVRRLADRSLDNGLGRRDFRDCGRSCRIVAGEACVAHRSAEGAQVRVIGFCLSPSP
jgi:hypothetical protein